MALPAKSKMRWHTARIALAAQAWRDGLIQDEVITAFPEPYRQWIDKDNNIREDSSLESYAKLRPAFDRKFGYGNGR